MDLNGGKALCAGILFVVALAGAALSLFAASFSAKIVRVCNAGAGGILLAVTLVHMLSENSEELEQPGVKIAEFFTGNKSAEAFPLGFALAGLGFLAILSVEVFLPGREPDESRAVNDEGRSSGYHRHQRESSEEDFDSDSEAGSDVAEIIVLPSEKSCAAGLSALIGLCVHSFINGAATGAAGDVSDLFQMFVAIIAHKLFACFSAGSLLLHSVSMRAWWALMVLLGSMTPLGIALGALLTTSFEGPRAAGLVCVAAGSLLCVAVYDMLMPSLILGKGQWKRRSFLAALLGFCIMSLLAIWS